MGGGEAADTGKKLFRVNDHAACALEKWLDDDGGNFVAAFGEQLFEFSKAFDMADRACEAYGTMRAIGRMTAQNWKAKRIESRGEWRIIAHRHRPKSIAVVGVFECDDPALPGLAAIPPILNREFERDFDGSRAIVREKNVPQRRRNDFSKTRCQLLGRLVRKSRKENMFQARGLFGDGGSNGGMRMPVQIRPPGRYGVEDLAAVLSFKKYSFTTANLERRGISAFVRERVPQMQVGCAHGLAKRLVVKMLLKDFEQRRAVDFFEQGDIADDTYIAVMFNGAPVIDVLRADQDDAMDV